MIKKKAKKKHQNIKVHGSYNNIGELPCASVKVSKVEGGVLMSETIFECKDYSLRGAINGIKKIRRMYNQT